MSKVFLMGLPALYLWSSFALAMDIATMTLRTTEDLYHVCTVSPAEPLQREALNLCEGFLVGAVSYHDAISDKQHLKRLICYPEQATRDEAVQAFVDWASTHQPDQRFMHDSAVLGVVRGLAAKWPCQ